MAALALPIASLRLKQNQTRLEHVRCSVVIAARDEEARIEGTLRHLLAQRGIKAEFIVVDDRSTDRTGDGEMNQSPP